jgi:hypothetical protein
MVRENELEGGFVNMLVGRNFGHGR